MSTYPYFRCLFALFATKSSPARAIFRSIHREMICARCAAFQYAKSCIDSFFLARGIKSYNALLNLFFEQNFGILKYLGVVLMILRASCSAPPLGICLPKFCFVLSD